MGAPFDFNPISWATAGQGWIFTGEMRRASLVFTLSESESLRYERMMGLRCLSFLRSSIDTFRFHLQYKKGRELSIYTLSHNQRRS